MAGMHMDKGGAAAFAGFVKTVSLLKPKGLKVKLLILPSLSLFWHVISKGPSFRWLLSSHSYETVQALITTCQMKS